MKTLWDCLMYLSWDDFTNNQGVEFNTLDLISEANYEGSKFLNFPAEIKDNKIYCKTHIFKEQV